MYERIGLDWEFLLQRGPADGFGSADSSVLRSPSRRRKLRSRSNHYRFGRWNHSVSLISYGTCISNQPPVRRSWVSLYLAQCTLRHVRCFYPHAPMLYTQCCKLHFLMPPHPNIAATPPRSGLASLLSFAWTSTVMYFSCKADLNFFASGFGSLPCS